MLRRSARAFLTHSFSNVSVVTTHLQIRTGVYLGAKSPLAQENLTKQDLAFLDALEFLSLCASSEGGTGLTFKPLDLRRKLLKLLDLMDSSKPLHLHMVSNISKL